MYICKLYMYISIKVICISIYLSIYLSIHLPKLNFNTFM